MDRIVKSHGGKDHFYALRNACLRLTTQQGGKKTTYDEFYDFEKEQVESSPGHPVPEYWKKRNYFLFSFPFKLLDQGITSSKLEDAFIFKKRFHRLKVTNRSDTYDIFVDPSSFLLEYVKIQKDETLPFAPLYIQFSNQEIHGMKIPVERKFFRVDSSGLPAENPAYTEKLSNLVFWCRGDVENVGGGKL